MGPEPTGQLSTASPAFLHTLGGRGHFPQALGRVNSPGPAPSHFGLEKWCRAQTLYTQRFLMPLSKEQETAFKRGVGVSWGQGLGYIQELPGDPFKLNLPVNVKAGVASKGPQLPNKYLHPIH